MEVSKIIELARISEIKIFQNAKLVHRFDLNNVYSKENLRVQFLLEGEIRGAITCHLCLDGHELEYAEKNYIIPLFVESMNILVGRQISLDEEINHFKIKLSSPKISMISQELDTARKSSIQKYDLELEHFTFCILVDYSLEVLN